MYESLIPYVNTLKEHLSNNVRGWSKWIHSNNTILDLIVSILFPTSLSLSEKIYWIVYNLQTLPLCPICDKQITTYRGFNKGYRKYCSAKCAQSSKEVREKIATTSLKKYGVNNPFKSEVVKEKYKQTCILKYGVDNTFKSTVIKDKIKETCLQTYGVDNPMKCEQIQEKVKDTLQKKYGVSCGYAVHPPYNRSKGEIELFNYVLEITQELVIANDNTVLFPFEIDIYIPSYKIGIEYDGDYWHSLPNMVKRDKIKDNLAKNYGITLFRIRESEWLINKDNVKTFIKEILKGERR